MSQIPHDHVNLLPKDPFNESPLGKTLIWALSVGRYIVVFTELVVIISFLSRFSLDRRLTDANVQVLKAKTAVEQNFEIEGKANKLQATLTELRQVVNLPRPEIYLPIIESTIPEAVKLSQLNLRPGQVILEGNALTRDKFNEYITNLEIDERVQTLSINKLEVFDQGTSVDFLVTIYINDEVTKQRIPNLEVENREISQVSAQTEEDEQ